MHHDALTATMHPISGLGYWLIICWLRYSEVRLLLDTWIVPIYTIKGNAAVHWGTFPRFVSQN